MINNLNLKAGIDSFKFQNISKYLDQSQHINQVQERIQQNNNVGWLEKQIELEWVPRMALQQLQKYYQKYNMYNISTDFISQQRKQQSLSFHPQRNNSNSRVRQSYSLQRGSRSKNKSFQMKADNIDKINKSIQGLFSFVKRDNSIEKFYSFKSMQYSRSNELNKTDQPKNKNKKQGISTIKYQSKQANIHRKQIDFFSINKQSFNQNFMNPQKYDKSKYLYLNQQNNRQKNFNQSKRKDYQFSSENNTKNNEISVNDWWGNLLNQIDSPEHQNIQVSHLRNDKRPRKNYLISSEDRSKLNSQ